MSSLSSTSITSALELFKADAGRLPQRFHSDFYRKLIGGNALQWILANGSNTIADPSGRQYPNGLAGRTDATAGKKTTTETPGSGKETGEEASLGASGSSGDEWSGAED